MLSNTRLYHKRQLLGLMGWAALPCAYSLPGAAFHPREASARGSAGKNTYKKKLKACFYIRIYLKSRFPLAGAAS